MAKPNEPITRTESYLAAIAGDGNTIPEPVTRKETYLAAIAGEDVNIPAPITREEQYLAYIAENGSGSGVSPDDAVLINKSVSSNGTYTAANDNADGYKKVTVNVPNTYAAGDEGKVVSSGALVSQTAHAEVTANGTIDTTLNNSVVVNVPSTEPTGTKQISISQNGTTTEDVAAYANAAITVAVPVPTLTALSVTDNGTYTPTSGTAYNSVVVAIPTATGVTF